MEGGDRVRRGEKGAGVVVVGEADTNYRKRNEVHFYSTGLKSEKRRANDWKDGGSE